MFNFSSVNASQSIKDDCKYSISTEDCFMENETQQKRTKEVNTFIEKLFNMVNNIENKHLITWNTTGNTFLVYSIKIFAQELLSVYFKHSNYSSFVRQLNMYGFHKLKKPSRRQGFEVWEFCHPKFQKNRPNLLREIKRKSKYTEVLRRENKNIYALVTTMQLSQANLLHQLRMLQESYSNLLQNLEHLNKTQTEQQKLLTNTIQQASSSLKVHLSNFDSPVSTTCPYNAIQSPKILIPFIDKEQEWSFPSSPDSNIQLCSSWNDTNFSNN